MIRCQACGTENPPDSAYCSKCARKLDPATQQAVVEQRSAHANTGLRWTSIAMAMLVILILILVVALFVTGVL